MQDELLREGVRLHRASGWKAVAEFVGQGMTLDNCQKRWHAVLAHEGGDLTKGAAWSEEQVLLVISSQSQRCIDVLHTVCSRFVTV